MDKLGTAEWRFPGNDYGVETGLSDSNSELFKEDTLGGLAREIVQNSIDAKLDECECVRVEFSCFDIAPEQIPDLDELKRRIQDAINTHEGTEGDTIGTLYDMQKGIERNTIHCCRISDFNTSGLLGVSKKGKEGRKTKWQLFTRCSGLTDKGMTSGGSKGIGKYATFVNSEFGTVFYSTLTIDGEKGYTGIIKLCSAEQEGTDELTQGMGFYSIDNEKSAIPEQFNIDSNYRERTESGTDIFILGFIQRENWEQELITKLLDSFIVAIYRETLELVVGKHQINKENLHEYVLNPKYVDPDTEEGNNAISQYYMLTKSGEPYEIKIGGSAVAELYVLDCSKQYTDYETNPRCIMVRYPYMKIQLDRIEDVNWDYAAMCIIGNNDLNRALRNVENPLHKKWEINRLDNKPEDMKKLKAAYNSLKRSISDYIKKKLSITSTDSSDLYGSEEFISMEEKDDGIPINKTSDRNRKLDLQPYVVIKKKRVVSTRAQIPDSDGYGLSPDIVTNGVGETEILSSKVPGKAKKANPGLKETSDKEIISESGRIALKYDHLREMNYRISCRSIKRGEYAIAFESEYDEPYVEITINAVDVSDGKTESVSIYSATVNGERVFPIDFKAIPLSLTKGKKVKIEFQTDRTELFRLEVDADAITYE